VTQVRIALVGDYNPAVPAHQAIPIALNLAARANATPVQFDWKHTSQLGSLTGYHGIWCIPASPYANELAAIDAIRYAREEGIPFLGTCGGFQHAVLEFARNVLGLSDAQHAETAADNGCLVISRLSCSLVEEEQYVFAVPGTRLAGCYGTEGVRFGYHCNFGLNPRFEQSLEAAGMRVAARDAAGEVRAVELAGHPFFVGTLFQPERSLLKGEDSPIINAFIESATAFASP
jgi:CTP synthase (UTP-ammonia lyase)